MSICAPEVEPCCASYIEALTRTVSGAGVGMALPIERYIPLISDDPSLVNPQLHRYLAGGTFGGPYIKNKLFGFVSYQHLQVSDQEIGDNEINVPVGLSDTTRTAGAFAGIINNTFGSGLTAANIDNTALALFNSPAVAGESGKWLIPNDVGSSTMTPTHPFNAFLPGTGRFKADTAVANLDYNATNKDTISLKYFYQHDPTIAPYAYS